MSSKVQLLEESLNACGFSVIITVCIVFLDSLLQITDFLIMSTRSTVSLFKSLDTSENIGLFCAEVSDSKADRHNCEPLRLN